MTRVQREAERLRATLWAHGINPVSIPGANNNNSSVGNSNPARRAARAVPKGVPRGHPDGMERRRDTDRQEKRRQKLAPLSHVGCSSGGSSIAIRDDFASNGRGGIMHSSLG